MAKKKKEIAVRDECFIIMPISDPEGYNTGHFKHVYENIIKPSCEMAGFSPIRADDVKATNLIHLDILKKLIETPIAICDLSSRNPNVLFELGIRQAFDKPVVLIQENDTPRIFDIAPLRCLNYSKEMKYHEVLKSQKEITEAIIATMTNIGDESNVNSIVKLLALSKAAFLPEIKENKENMALNLIQAEMQEMRKLFEKSVQVNEKPALGTETEKIFSIIPNDLENINFIVHRIKNSDISSTEKILKLRFLLDNIKEGKIRISREDSRARLSRTVHAVSTLINDYEKNNLINS